MVKIRYMTTTQAARRLRLTPRAVRKLAERRGHGRKVLGRLLFTAAEFRDMKQRRGGPPRVIDQRRRPR